MLVMMSDIKKLISEATSPRQEIKHLAANVLKTFNSRASHELKDISDYQVLSDALQESGMFAIDDKLRSFQETKAYRNRGWWTAKILEMLSTDDKSNVVLSEVTAMAEDTWSESREADVEEWLILFGCDPDDVNELMTEVGSMSNNNYTMEYAMDDEFDEAFNDYQQSLKMVQERLARMFP